MRLSHGVYYHVAYKDTETGRKQVWLRLSRDYSKALSRWAVIEGDCHSQGTTVSKGIDRYLIEVLPKHAKTTRREYIRHANQVRPVFGCMELSDVTGQHIAQYRDNRSKPISANRELAFLSTVFSKCLDWGWLQSNPCHGIRRNKESKREKYVLDSEIEKIREVASPQVQYIIDLALITALRKKDILSIKLSDFNNGLLTVTTSKTGKVQVFEMSPALTECYEKTRKLRRRVGSVYLFCNRSGQSYVTEKDTCSGFDSIWQRLKKKTGVDFTFHDLRGKTLTDARNKHGRDYAQDLAGHESGETTERYIKRKNTIVPMK